jgi:uncharacterized protein (DUF488 family)
MSALVFTIGHSTHSTEKLLGLLVQHEITAVADVRSQPYSRMNPQFNRELLRDALKTASISYVFLGRELGARTEDRSCYVDGKVQYDRLARTELFQQGLARVINGAGRHRIALLCAEKDPLTCHRAILVVRQLVARGLRTAHILDDGRVESHDDALDRLLKEEGIQSDDFFKPRHELIDEAYAKRGNAIAYIEKPGAAGDASAERNAP